MARYARVAGGAVAELIVLPDGLSPAVAFHPSLADTIHPCGEDVAEGWTFDGSVFAAPVAEAQSHEVLLTYAADKRWRIETGGITVGGMSLETDRASQAMITGAYAWSQANPGQSIAFKAATGFVTLDASAIESIASAVGSHVQSCFAVEAAVSGAITAGTVTDFADIDDWAWPA